MNLFKNITRGGQVQLHQLRMLKQVLTVSLVVSVMAGVGYWGAILYSLPPFLKRATFETLWARTMITTTPQDMHQNLKQLYTPEQGLPHQRSCLSILRDPYLQRATSHTEELVTLTSYDALRIMGGVFLFLMNLWFLLGLLQKRTQHQRGVQLVSWRELRRLLKRHKKESDLHLGPLPFVKDKETSHILITGTTGSGKTHTITSLLPQIRKRGDRAIILDVTGDYVKRFYNPETDIILNPLDPRSPYWHPWADCKTDSHYDLMAESFIQTKSGNRDPFWDNASRMVFKTALRKFNQTKHHDVEALYTFLMTATDKAFESFFKGTEAASFTTKANEKTTQSIRSVLSSQIEGLRQLKKPENPESTEDTEYISKSKNQESPSSVFSIREWVKENEENAYFPEVHNLQLGQNAQEIPKAPQRSQHPSPKGWLFITALPDQRETLRPLISAWIDIAINALMTQSQRTIQKLWFVMDELAALQNLPRLHTGLAEARKYGGCFLVGFQSKPQLEEIYGRNSAESMLDLFNTKLFFRCTEPSTQQWISKVLGDKEETESQESISYGAHSVRDGVSLSQQTRQKPLILPTELSQLKDLECFVKYPGDYPCTKVQMTYQPLQHSQYSQYSQYSQHTPYTQQSLTLEHPSKTRGKEG